MQDIRDTPPALFWGLASGNKTPRDARRDQLLKKRMLGTRSVKNAPHHTCDTGRVEHQRSKASMVVREACQPVSLVLSASASWAQSDDGPGKPIGVGRYICPSFGQCLVVANDLHSCIAFRAGQREISGIRDRIFRQHGTHPFSAQAARASNWATLVSASMR